MDRFKDLQATVDATYSDISAMGSNLDNINAPPFSDGDVVDGVQLKIHIEGEGDSIARHELSLVRFADSLELVVTALQRCAEAESSGAAGVRGPIKGRASDLEVALSLDGAGDPVVEYLEERVEGLPGDSDRQGTSLHYSRDEPTSTAKPRRGGVRRSPAAPARFAGSLMNAHRAYRPASASFGRLPCHTAVWPHWSIPLVNNAG